jgi:hypothetical protein
MIHKLTISSSKLWKQLNPFINPNKKAGINHNDLACGNPHYTKQDMVNAFSNYFSSILNNTAFCNLLDSRAYISKHLSQAVEQNCKLNSSPIFSFTELSVSCVSQTLARLDPHSSPGIVGIDTRIFKHCHEELAPYITLLFNECIRTCTIPKEWKIAYITPILKAKAPKSSISSYRPISLLPPIAKAFESLIARQITVHFERNNLLSDNQFGFRHGRSCELAMNTMIEYWKQNLDKGKRTIAIFLDLSKAFDTINHELLVEKLHRYYNFDSSSRALIECYLKERFCLVKQCELKSEMEPLRTGVPQGSILGPLLFIIFVNDLNYLNISSKLYQYADDTTITFASDSLAMLTNTLTIDLAQVANWLYHNHLLLNVKKTQAMDLAITNRRTRVPAPQIEYDGTPISYVDHVTLLGVTFNKNLNFDKHTVNICKKINTKTFILLRCAHLFHFNFRIILFKLFIQSHFDYCSTVYSHLTNISTCRINRCFRRTVYKLLKIDIKNMSIDEQLSGLSKYNILPLPLRLIYRFNTFLFSLMKNNNKSVISSHILSHKNARDNLILPKIHTDLLKYSFSTVAIKILNLYLLEKLLMSKENFSIFLKREILGIYNKTIEFFS